MMDEKIVAEMDQKVLDQQNTLEKAGVPGFYITTNPQVTLCLHSKQKSLMVNENIQALARTAATSSEEISSIRCVCMCVC